MLAGQQQISSKEARVHTSSHLPSPSPFATAAAATGLGDIMLTCYGSLSRNRSVGVRLGQGEKLSDILASSSQVAEGVPTAGAHWRRCGCMLYGSCLRSACCEGLALPRGGPALQLA